MRTEMIISSGGFRYVESKLLLRIGWRETLQIFIYDDIENTLPEKAAHKLVPAKRLGMRKRSWRIRMDIDDQIMATSFLIRCLTSETVQRLDAIKNPEKRGAYGLI